MISLVLWPSIWTMIITLEFSLHISVTCPDNNRLRQISSQLRNISTFFYYEFHFDGKLELREPTIDGYDPPLKIRWHIVKFGSFSIYTLYLQKWNAEIHAEGAKNAVIIRTLLTEKPFLRWSFRLEKTEAKADVAKFLMSRVQGERISMLDSQWNSATFHKLQRDSTSPASLSSHPVLEKW